MVTVEKKDGWPPAMRQAILMRDKVCQYNGPWCVPDYPWPEVDHIDPDGPHSMENGRQVCRHCHTQIHREEER